MMVVSRGQQVVRGGGILVGVLTVCSHSFNSFTLRGRYRRYCVWSVRRYHSLVRVADLVKLPH